MKKSAFVIYYHRHNFYSLNAIAGALETDDIFENIDFFFISSKDELIVTIETLINNYIKVVVAISFTTVQLFEIIELMGILKNKRFFFYDEISFPRHISKPFL